MTRLAWMVVGLLSAFSSIAQQKPTETYPFLEVQAWPKADVPALLERYKLYDAACNMQQFFVLNKVKENYTLKTGKTYKIPILIYPYNGKSIRTTLNITDLKQALRIEAFNKDMQRLGVRSDDFKVTKALWVPWHELNCTAQPNPAPPAVVVEAPPAKVEKQGEKSKRIPPILKLPAPETPLKPHETGANARSIPLFGTQYAKTPLLSKRLLGQVFYVVSGHGGPDVGAQGRHLKHTICEDEYAYDVSLRLARLLLSHGATVYMLVQDPNDGIRDEPLLHCDKDEFVWGKMVIPRGQKSRLFQRSDLLNALYARHEKLGAKKQSFIEIHVDSRSQYQRTDVFFYYRPESQASMVLAQQVHRIFMEKYRRAQANRLYRGTVTPRALHMLRETDIPRAVYVELANIRNDWDKQRLIIPSNRQALANWLFSALAQ